MLNKSMYCAVVCAMGLMSSAAHADIKWTFTNTALGLSSGATVSTSTSYSGVGGATTVKVSSWADTGAAGDASNNKLLGAITHTYSGGLGVQWQTSGGATLETPVSPEHSIDNCGSFNTSTNSCNTTTGAGTPEDFVLFTFSQAVTLQEVAVGWAFQDSDISVLAYTGAGTPASLTGDTYAASDAAGGLSVGLTNAGWTLIGNYTDLHTTCSGANPDNCSASDPGTTAVGTSVSSSYWMVGAYNSRLSATDPGISKDNDFVKLLSLTASLPTTHTNPEPGTLALLALAISVLYTNASYRRRRVPLLKKL